VLTAAKGKRSAGEREQEESVRLPAMTHRQRMKSAAAAARLLRPAFNETGPLMFE
jgi:hypothetical protein